MRSAMIAGLVVAGVALGGTGEASAMQSTEGWAYCASWDGSPSWGRSQRYSDVFSPSSNAERMDHQWQERESMGNRLAKCYWFATEEEAHRRRDAEIQAGRDNGLGAETVSWRPAGSRPSSRAATPPPVQTASPPPPAAQAAPPPTLPSLVVRSPSAEEEESARRLNEENARRNREAAERDAAARARYEQQRREYEAAMERNRQAQERYRRECERVRAQGGSCVISR